MNSKGNALINELDLSKIMDPRRLTLTLDATEAQDSASLNLSIAKALQSSKQSLSAPFLFVSTRSRSEFDAPDGLHAHPHRSHLVTSAVERIRTFDPYSKYKSYGPHSTDRQKRLLVDVLKVAMECKPSLIILECIFSLRFAFGANPSAFVRTLLSQGYAVLAGCPTGCGVNSDVRSLEDIADTVIDLRDLQTGVAVDVDGLLKVSKQDGRWKEAETFRRYKVTDASFSIFT